MKKALSLALAALLCLGLIVPVAAATSEAQAAADSLHALGLFNGVGNNADGSPNFDLDRAPTRAEAVTLLVRLLGKEADARVGQWSNGFTDVPDWAKPYVGYAYQNGLTTGNSATSFGSEETVSAAQYLTFVLRALGYSSGSDFSWDKSFDFTDELGLTKGEYNESSAFLRGDAVVVSFRALDMKVKGGDKTLLAVIEENLENAPPVPKTPAELVAEGVQKLTAAESVMLQTKSDITLTIGGGLSESVAMQSEELICFFANPQKYYISASMKVDGVSYVDELVYLIPTDNAYMVYARLDGEWVSRSITKEEAQTASIDGALINYLADLTGITSAGEATINGQKVTKYSALLPNIALFREGDGTSARVMLSGLAEGFGLDASQVIAAVGDIPAAVYLNSAGQIVRLELDMTQGLNEVSKAILTAIGYGDSGITMTTSNALVVTDYTNYNSVPDFDAPAMD